MKVKELIQLLQDENQDAEAIDERGRPIYAVHNRWRSVEGDAMTVLEKIVIHFDPTAPDSF